jgi:type I restriction enzyme S subunit
MPFSWITGNAMVVHPHNHILTKIYLYEFLLSYGVEKYISGSVQKQLTRENLSVMPIIIPPIALLNKFDIYTKSISQYIIKITYENQKLIKLRNWLLPMLMNGQATISD